MYPIKVLINILKNEQLTTLSRLEKKLLTSIKQNTRKQIVINKIFPNASNKQKAYSKLEGLLKQKLLNKLLHVNLSDVLKSKEIELRRRVIILQTVTLKSKIFDFIVAEKILKSAIEFELWDVVFHVGSICQMYSVEVKRDFKLNKKIESYVNLAIENIAIIQKINIAYTNILKGQSSHIFSKPVDFRSGFFYYVGNSYLFEINKEYKKIISVCKEGVIYFESKKYETSFAVEIINRRMIPSSIIINDSPQERINKSFELEPHGTVNYYLIVAYQAILYIKRGEYKRSIEYIDNIIDEVDNEYRKEQLLLVTAWASLFTSNNRARKVINDISLFEKEKAHDKASIRLLEVFYLFKRKDYEKLYAIQESLITFSIRYLKDSKRFKIMFSIVDLAISNSFDLDHYSSKLDEKLSELDQTKIENINIEVVDFRLLVEYFLLKP